ncbi:MAG: hypothetical protein Q4B70_18195, partial [Lachnospiraceae bacterium]|nr:hypothetical protein [Lachnospiraceae bacterium]
SALEVNEQGVIGENADGKTLFEAETVINALGMKPVSSTSNELRFCAPEFYDIGISGNSTIAKAVCEGHYAALNIGR